MTWVVQSQDESNNFMKRPRVATTDGRQAAAELEPTMGETPRGTLIGTADRSRPRFRPSASAASIESVVNPIFSPFARACRRRTSSSLCLDPSWQRSLLRLSLGPTSHQPSSVPGITPWSEPGFHLGLVGHRFVRSLEGAYPCYRISSFRWDHALERMLPLDPFRQGGLRTPEP